MPSLAFSGSASVKLTGGNGQASAGPKVPGEVWQITGVAVSVATNVNEAQCSIYATGAGPFTPVPGQLLGTTSTGSTGDTLGPAITLAPGQVLVAVWSGGDAGELATMSYWGTRTVP